MEVIALCNQKGGVGKTTTATCLAMRLKELGYKSLMIDMDPQCNATDTYHASYDGVSTLYDVLVDDQNIKESIQKTAAGDIVAGDPLLSEAEAKITGIGREMILASALEDLKGYDYVILDCPPNLGILSNNALLAADKLVVPVTPERFAIMGLSQLAKTVAKVRKLTNNKKLKIDGLLLVRVDSRQKLSREVLDTLPDVCEKIGTKCYKTFIREGVAIKKSQSVRMTLYDWEKENGKSGVGDDYRNFVDEFLKGR